MRSLTLAVLASSVLLGACASGATSHAQPSHAKPGYFTHVHDGRLWVLKEGDMDIELVAKNKEPKVVVTRIAAGPNNMTMKSNNATVIDAYLGAK